MCEKPDADRARRRLPPPPPGALILQGNAEVDETIDVRGFQFQRFSEGGLCLLELSLLRKEVAQVVVIPGNPGSGLDGLAMRRD